MANSFSSSTYMVSTIRQIDIPIQVLFSSIVNQMQLMNFQVWHNRSAKRTLFLEHQLMGHMVFVWVFLIKVHIYIVPT